MKRLSDELATRVWEIATRGVLSHGFAIRFDDLSDQEQKKTGTFDGLEIVLHNGNEFQLQIFILLHLFGHSVQWVAPSLEHTLQGIQEKDDLNKFLVFLRHYEFEAARFGLQLLHDGGVSEADDWFTEMVDIDWQYVRLYYLSGMIPSLEDAAILSSNPPKIEPLKIPELRHRRVKVRYAF